MRGPSSRRLLLAVTSDSRTTEGPHVSPWGPSVHFRTGCYRPMLTGIGAEGMPLATTTSSASPVSCVAGTSNCVVL